MYAKNGSSSSKSYHKNSYGKGRPTRPSKKPTYGFKSTLSLKRKVAADVKEKVILDYVYDVYADCSDCIGEDISDAFIKEFMSKDPEVFEIRMSIPNRMIKGYNIMKLGYVVTTHYNIRNRLEKMRRLCYIVPNATLKYTFRSVEIKNIIYPLITLISKAYQSTSRNITLVADAPEVAMVCESYKWKRVPTGPEYNSLVGDHMLKSNTLIYESPITRFGEEVSDMDSAFSRIFEDNIKSVIIDHFTCNTADIKIFIGKDSIQLIFDSTYIEFTKPSESKPIDIRTNIPESAVDNLCIKNVVTEIIELESYSSTPSVASIARD